MTESNTDFWRGAFGDEYGLRNDGAALLASKTAMLRKMTVKTFGYTPKRVIEFGANIGLNIIALSSIHPYAGCEFSAVEVNASACEQLAMLKGVDIYQTPMQDTERPWGHGYDLSMSMGVLIHMHPDDLPACCAALWESSRRHILIAEYFSPTPEEVTYRGESGRLFKRDFGRLFMDLHPEARCVDYGFFWSHDPHIAHGGDITWWLFDKTPRPA